MSSTLATEQVSTLLDQFFEEADQDDARVATVLREHPALTSWEERAELLDEAVIPVSRAAGRLLYSVVRSIRPQTVVEYGMSFGVLTLHLAAAMRDTYRGQVITTELRASKIARARAHLEEAGLVDLVTVLEGDTLDPYRSCRGRLIFCYSTAGRTSRCRCYALSSRNLCPARSSSPTIRTSSQTIWASISNMSAMNATVTRLLGFQSLTGWS